MDKFELIENIVIKQTFLRRAYGLEVEIDMSMDLKEIFRELKEIEMEVKRQNERL